MIRTCPKCKAAAPPGARRCRCGAPLAATARATVAPKRRSPLVLLVCVAGGVLLVLVVALAFLISSGRREAERLARKADQMVKIEKQLAAAPPLPKPVSEAPPPAPVADPGIHRDERRGFSIPIPAGWRVRPSSDPEIALEMSNGDAAGSHFALIVKPGAPPGLMDGGFSFQAIADALVADLRSAVQDLQVLRREPDRCCGHPAYLLTYSCRAQGTAASTLQYLVATPSAVHTLTWSTRTDLFRGMEPVFEKASKGFTVPPPGPFRPATPRGFPVRKPAPAEATPEPPRTDGSVVRHSTLGFSLPVPPGWQSQEMPRRSTIGAAVLLSVTDRETGGSGTVSVDQAPRELATGKLDLQGWLKAYRGIGYGTVVREEAGTCSGFPALLAVYGSGGPTPKPSRISYFVSTGDLIYEIKWQCMIQHYERLAPVFEKCSKGFTNPPPK